TGVQTCALPILNSFGGPGGQHACLVADSLGIEAVLIHPLSGLLSAYGIGLSSIFASRQQALLQPLSEAALPAINELVEKLRAEVLSELSAQGVSSDDV